MKHGLKIIVLLLLTSTLFSCNTYYQVIETSSNQVKKVGEQWLFDTTDIKISYNFWSDGSIMSFSVHNKRSSPIFLDLSKCHLILNEKSIDYYSENVVTLSHSLKTTTPVYWDWLVSTENQGSVAYKMKKIIEIPPNSYVTVDNLKILPTYISDCDLTPRFGYVVGNNYTVENTPYSFANFITYSVSESFAAPVIVTNNFWISKVEIMYPREFGKMDYGHDCFGNMIGLTTSYKKPQNFYFSIHK